MGFGEAFRGAKIALIHGAQLVVYQRDDKPDIPFPGLWDLPGGGREDDETPEACALREVEEEFGLSLDPARIVETVFYPAGSPDALGSFFLVADITATEITAIRFGSEGQRWALTSIEDFMAHPEVIPHFKTRLQAFLDRRAVGATQTPMDRESRRMAPLDLVVRSARVEDAEAACDVLRRSITELCVADHGHDPAILSRWLANKTPETVAGWIAKSRGGMMVGLLGEKIVSVGAVTDAGEVTLNYVAPEARFLGVSRAMLAGLEAWACERGIRRCRLVSTETAYRFYRANNYGDDGPAQSMFGTRVSHPMAKDMSA